MKKQRIAILPFENKSDESWDYLAEGLAELALNTLSPSPSLLVIAKESIDQLIQAESFVTDVQDKLQVDILLSAALEVSDSLQLTVVAKKPGQEEPLWEETMSADMKQVVLFGNDLIAFLNKQFEITDVSAASAKNKVPQNRQAYRAYLLGHHYLTKWNRAYTELALSQFEKVVELEPDFIPAYLGIAKANVFLVSRGWRSAEANYPEVSEMLDRMLLLNPNYGELYIYKGIIEFFYLLDWKSAYLNIEKGLKNYSEASEAYAQLSLFWYGMRQYDKAIEAIHVAMEYNPLSVSLLNMVGDVQLSAERYEEANKTFQSILELQPNDKVALENLMYIGAITDNVRVAKKYLRLLTKDHDVSVVTYPRLAYVYPKLGMEAETEAVFHELEQLIKEDKNANHYTRMANYYLAQNDLENTMTCLEQSFPLRTGVLYILTDPQLKPLRHWKRYQKLEQQINLPTDILSEAKITIHTALKTKVEVEPSHLLYARSEENYTTLVLYNNFRLEEVLLRMSLKSLLAQLPSAMFFQCHRSYVINKTLSLASIGNSRGFILQSKEYGFEIPVSRSRIAAMKVIV